MQSIALKIFLTFVLQTCAKEHDLADTLLNRKLSAWAAQNSDLDNAMLGKPGRLANLPQSQGALHTRPVVPPTSAGIWQARPATSYNPTFHSALLSKNNLPPVVARAEVEVKNPKITLHTLVSPPRKPKKRLARGYGGKGGGTAGRGTRGQKSRSGWSGNTPNKRDYIARRNIKYKTGPRMKGFTNEMFKKNVAIINTGQLQQLIDTNRLDVDKPITTLLLKELGIVKKKIDGVKLLGEGDLDAKVNLELQWSSASAQEAVESKGGTITLDVGAGKVMPPGRTADPPVDPEILKLPRKMKKQAKKKALAGVAAPASA